jgi:serine/threonine protein kinase
VVEPTKRFGPFTVVSQIAATTHSRVWAATDPSGKPVAVKELKTHRLDAEPYRRFRDEVTFHMAGPHPGVLPVLDAHVPSTPTGEDPAWLTMPIVETVRAALGTGPTLDQIVEAVHVYADTLARLAARHVHHRDVKPDNLFRHASRWVVGDFGLVTWPGKQALTEPGQKLGPVHFVAPEMVEDPVTADPAAADVWSLAKVLWVLGSGQNYPPPGQLRIGDRATLLRNYNSHPQASGIEGILEQATRLAPSERPTMRTFASELETWLTPAQPRRDPASIDDLVERVRAISAPFVAAGEQQAEWRGEAAVISDRLRAAHNVLLPLMQRLGRVTADDQALSMHGLGGKTGRRDVALTWAETLALIQSSPHQVSLTVDLAWQLFKSWDMRLVVGMYFQSTGYLQSPGERLPEVFVLETRDVRVGTEHGRRAADELAQLLVDRFSPAAAATPSCLPRQRREPNRPASRRWKARAPTTSSGPNRTPA